MALFYPPRPKVPTTEFAQTANPYSTIFQRLDLAGFLEQFSFLIVTIMLHDPARLAKAIITREGDCAVIRYKEEGILMTHKYKFKETAIKGRHRKAAVILRWVTQPLR